MACAIGEESILLILSLENPGTHNCVVVVQNGFAESFHSRFRDEFLNEEVFLSVLDAQVRMRVWQRYYNQERLHSSLGYQTPIEFAAQWAEKEQGNQENVARTKEAIGPANGG